MQLNTVAIQNRICPGMDGVMLHEGTTLLVCISTSPALYHLAVIFSCVKPTGNSRHSFAIFPTNRNPWSHSGRTFQRHFKGLFQSEECVRILQLGTELMITLSSPWKDGFMTLNVCLGMFVSSLFPESIRYI